MEPRHASVAVIGAGDYAGAAIAKRFAREGYLVFAGRCGGGKLVSLVDAITAEGGRCVGRGRDARKEEHVAAFIRDADAAAPLEVCIFNVGANVYFPILAATERAVARGLFGLPAFFVGDETYVGQDRLRDVEGEIARARQAR